jgi:orotidine-5'-phosphate decarboxylase
MFSDHLLEAITAKGSPICVGIDPMYDAFPDAIAGPAEARRKTPEHKVLDHFHSFISEVLKIVQPAAPIVKFQSAYFEQYHHEGVQAYYELVREAKDLGLLVIGDIKRGDIGSTSTAYAAGHLSDFAPDLEDLASPDAITINPMLGMDSIEPFVSECEKLGKGLFVLVRTSNPGSKDFQDVMLQSGKTWSEHVADMLHARAIDPKLVGRQGFSNLGAVVGATQTHTMQSLRKRLPQSIFLLPGYGTQGATADMTRSAFNENGQGAIVSASRSILYPKSTGTDWRGAIRDAVQAMKSDLARLR